MPTDIITIGRGILEAGSSAALIGLLVVLAVPNLKKKIFGNGNGHGSEELKTMMRELQHHYNDETTEILKDIKEAIKEHDAKEIPLLNDIKTGIEIIKVKQNGHSK